jgi:mono/diheme cytochrome c family protein
LFRRGLYACIAGWLAALLLLPSHPEAIAQQPSASSSAPSSTQRALVDKYCVTCHNQRTKAAGLTLDAVDLSNVPASPQIWEKVIRKLRGGMMPPVGMPRPDQTALTSLASYLESSIDAAAAADPHPGRTVLHRLNRAEYGNALRDLLALDVDVASFLPPDEEAYGFDNIGAVLGMSPALMERYLSAAWKISALAVGSPKITPAIETFRVRSDLSQNDHIEGLPIGTRGGLLVRYNFPVDGEYIIKPRLYRETVNIIRGLEVAHDLEITFDGERILLARFGGRDDELANYFNPTAAGDELEKRFQIRVPVKAGPHAVGVAFLKKSSAPTVELLQPFLRERIDPITPVGIPEVDKMTIEGPFNVTGSGDSPSRRRIFTCRPTGSPGNAGNNDGLPCARTILSTLGRRAYRRPMTDAELERLLTFYRDGHAKEGRFDAGIENALAFMLVSPQFLFRFERDPENAAPGTVYRIGDVELQVKRMLADQRARALGSNFAGQWLYLRNLKSHQPDEDLFPDFDDNLRQALKRETELLFENIVLEDRGILELLDASYTFVNERLARHYGIPNIYGDQFRRVNVPGDYRRGLLGQGSVLTLNSYANRTSPVTRGKYVLTNILGTPPPPPPADIPPLDEKPGKAASMRDRMEEHRKNPSCSGCHKLMDPIGLALENFDGIGRWRTTDAGARIDASSTLWDGTPVDGPAGLRQAILSRPEQFVGTATEMLLTYALGRGLEYYDMPVVRSIVRGSARQNFRFSSIVAGIVKSVPFQMRKVDEGETAGQ